MSRGSLPAGADRGKGQVLLLLWPGRRRGSTHGSTASSSPGSLPWERRRALCFHLAEAGRGLRWVTELLVASGKGGQEVQGPGHQTLGRAVAEVSLPRSPRGWV